MTTPQNDINAVIVSMAKDKINEAVRNAIVGDEIIGAFVRAALQAPVQAYGTDRYNSKTVPFIDNAVTSAIHQAAQNAIRKVVEEQASEIEAAVRAALIAGIPEIAGTLYSRFAGNVSGSGYGFDLKIEVVKEKTYDDD